ncbi:MAG TPA: hypothetical protein VL400_04095 [Polyangiaceae bacterium]|nr:hypothetical protein [Polyangiaceae bacterium]
MSTHQSGPGETLRELVETLESYPDEERDLAILRVIRGVLIPEWERAITSLGHGETTNPRLHALTVFHNTVMSCSFRFAGSAMPLDSDESTDELVATLSELAQRASWCCVEPLLEAEAWKLRSTPPTSTPS